MKTKLVYTKILNYLTLNTSSLLITSSRTLIEVCGIKNLWKRSLVFLSFEM